MVPVLKYVRGEHLSQDHWLDMFRLLGLPRGTTLERLTFNDLLGVANTIIEKALELKVCVHTLKHRHIHNGQTHILLQGHTPLLNISFYIFTFLGMGQGLLNKYEL